MSTTEREIGAGGGGTARGSASILVVDDDELIRDLVASTLAAEGFEVATAEDGAHALRLLDEAIPDLIVSDVLMPELDGFGLVDRLRSQPATRHVPLIFLTTRGRADDIVSGLDLGADDYLVKPFDMDVLVARVRSKLERRPVPVDMLPSDPRTGLLSERAFREELERELERAARAGRPGAVAVMALEEAARVRDAIGPRAVDELARQVSARLLEIAGPLDVLGRDRDGRFLILLPEADPEDSRRRLDDVAAKLAATPLRAAGERVRVTPGTGYAAFEAGLSAEALIERASIALSHAASHLDLRAQPWTSGMQEAPKKSNLLKGLSRLERLRVPFQIVVTWLLGLLVPFLIYLGLDQIGIDVTPIVYLVVVLALLVTGITIWMEGLAALRPFDPPEEPKTPYPKASAIIAAYMPNEAATIMDTLEAFLRIDYPNDLQVIVAYNTPWDMPIEAELAELAKREPRIHPFRVRGSTSKAQNVNAALAQVTGEFVGVFDADHQPMPDAFKRAWRWISDGWDVVQGHCLVRNGEASWVARTCAVEFEMIYAVSHPGRARLHGFGIFGGSNGYWRTDLLAEIRMRGSMLTEDIDSSLRVIEQGGKIVSDPLLVSRELGPATLSALWNQRMRWAQGWFQVSMKHWWQGTRNKHLSFRNKVGLFYLLAWREMYPWLSLQMFPVIAFLAYKAGGPGELDWFIPIFVLTSLFTLSVGPWQTLFAYRLAAPEIRARKKWFLWYLLASSIFYTELKNVIARVAQVKELMRERAWKITPRAADSADS